jgi:hypothetical protein
LHGRRVGPVVTSVGDFDSAQGQSGRLGLKLQQLQAYGVHGHSPVQCVDDREQAGQFDSGILPQDVERPGAILAAAPTQKCAHKEKGDKSNFWAYPQRIVGATGFEPATF